MIYLKSKEEINKIRKSAQINHEVLSFVASKVKPGVTTAALNDMASAYLRERNAKPSFLGFNGFKHTLCTSVNHIPLHGEPSDFIVLKEGDIIGLDLGVNYKGYFSDYAITVGVGNISEENHNLIETTYSALVAGLQQVKEGNRIKDITKAIYNYATSRGYEVLGEWCGHGVGIEVHEDPNIPNHINQIVNHRLKKGMVFAIEPVFKAQNGNTAHFEYTVALNYDGNLERLT